MNRSEVASLHDAWRAAYARLDHDQSDAARSSEQAAYDILVDYVEANGLNYTEHDPR